ncbi:glycoside hydrolase family 31 protein [Panacibacter ginsenosidivorans]|uniref:Glycoside hydrolase family 31 protein n=1 Tax=Panacibacter ginsenosidivorans TaxID=1813871 RepID=A0A5B8V999_9BACT|nr:TIM-barrel domain-containing protein [Panacibacter ginsenosidivorans]QEC67902.1 glycoside hydrolase family 31 protein [Panacibacter ginsenosidivorans]
MPAFIKSICLPFFLSAFFVASINAQITVDKIISYKKTTSGIEGKADNAIFDVHAYSENIIRVRVSKNKRISNFSYALVDTAVPAFNNISIEDKGNTVILSTSVIVAEIRKQPFFKIIFRDKQGDILNEDADATGFAGDRVTAYKQLQDGERFIGMGEALGNLDRRGSGITLNNTDNYKYSDPRVPMYSSIPFYMGIHHNLVYGLFFNNTYKAFFNFGLSTPFTSVSFDGGDMDYFFMYDTSVAKIIEHYTSLTGRTQLPPMWSLGYQQSRCTYYPQDKVMWIAETFRRKQIPIDGIVLDADYQLGYEPFRTNTQRFPDLPKLSSDLKKMNIELTASVYPGVNIDSSYDSYTDGLKKNIFIKTTDDKPFQTEIAPLKVHLPDYTNAKAREWWIDKMQWMKTNGINGYWNDMNEPAVGGSYLPDNLVFDFDGRKATAAEAKNVYGFQMARSSYEAALKNNNTQRPFVLTRSGFAGVQRYSAMWSGDNMATDEGLMTSVLLNTQFGISGVPFVGYDIGGYIGDGNKNLYTRWIEVGIFSPYCRNHREFFGAANEPWAYGEEAEAISKTYIGFRYQMMPYIYSAFYEASQTGLPVQRSLSINYPFDGNVYELNYQYQFLFGDAILVAPLTSKETSKKIYLPHGDWYNIYTDKKITAPKEFTQETPACQLPIYIKASAIIPMQSLVQSTKQKPADTLFLHVYYGKEKNTFTYYEDDGNTMAYKNGNFCKRNIEFDPISKQLIVSAQEGTYTSDFHNIKLMLHGFDKSINKIDVNYKPVLTGDDHVQLLNALENLDDIYDKKYYQSLKNSSPAPPVKTCTIINSPKQINISW